MKKKKLRLLLFEACNRNCTGCCNKDWDLKSLSYCTDYTPYSEILLTGGEPMLKPDLVIRVVEKIRRQTTAPIILYTADLTKPLWLFLIAPNIDGLTVTLHEPNDALAFKAFDKQFKPPMRMLDRLRLNVFKEVGAVEAKPYWKVKPDMEWIKNCPLPDGEVFMRYKEDDAI